MLVSLAVLSLVLLQENTRIPEDVQKKQRLQEADQHYRRGTEALQADEQSRLTPTSERPRFQTEIESLQAIIGSLEQGRGTDHAVVAPPADFALALGSAYLRAGAIEDAERAYREALGLRPKYGEAHNNLAVIAMKRGRYDEASAHVKAAQEAGFRVDPQMVRDIETARRATDK